MTTRLFVSVAFVALTASACGRAAVEKVETTEVVPVGIAPAHIGVIQNIISATGTISPEPGADWIITAPAAGRIDDMPKSEGQPVKVGDVLVKFDIPSLDSDLAARTSEVMQATAHVTTAHDAYVRASGLLDKGIIARKDVEEAQQRETEAVAELSQAQAAQKTAQLLVDRGTVRARFDGVVAKRWKNPGDFVDATVDTPVLRIVDPKRLEVIVSVPVSQLSHIILNNDASITNPVTGEEDAARVLTKPAAVDASSSTADIRLAFRVPTALSAGTGVTARIIGEELKQALIVPSVAITHNDDGEKVVMVVDANNKVHEQPVSIGMATHDLTEIRSGIKAGDQVVVRGLDGLPDGATVMIIK